MSEAAVDSKQDARPVAPWALLLAFVAAGGVALTSALAPAESHRAALFGAGSAALPGFAAFAAVAWGLRKGTQGLLAGFSIGFLVRMVAVAVGLIASGARGSAALVYAACFFALYAATQAVEIAFVWSRRSSP